ncbi:hypothetical protein NDI45_16475 [Leptolyngbya sp. GB1-A1]
MGHGSIAVGAWGVTESGVEGQFCHTMIASMITIAAETIAPRSRLEQQQHATTTANYSV